MFCKMAIAKKAKKASREIPAKKVVAKGATKFKKKNSDGTTGRKGRKKIAILVDADSIVDLVTRGPAPRNVIKIADQIVTRFEQRALKSFLRTALEKMDEKSRKSILRKYWRETKPVLSPEDKKALAFGRKALKMAKGATL